MNLLHIRYALEVAEVGSINKAAERLIIGQPNLSRAIKDLETSLGIKIFQRSAKGMTLTPEGEVFAEYAKKILKQVDSLENTFKKGVYSRKKFSVSVPGSNYISEAFCEFSNFLSDNAGLEIHYKETGAYEAINSVLQDDCRIAVIRYNEKYDRYYKTMMDEKSLDYEMVCEFKHKIVFSGKSPLAKSNFVYLDDLKDYIEITHTEEYVPSLPASEVKKDELSDGIYKRIFSYDRAQQFELLDKNHKTFMLSENLSPAFLEKYGLIIKDIKDNNRVFKDVLIHKNGYSFSKLDNLFIEKLIEVKRKIMTEE